MSRLDKFEEILNEYEERAMPQLTKFLNFNSVHKKLNEYSGFCIGYLLGTVREDGIYVTDVIIPDQGNNASVSVMDPKMEKEFLEEFKDSIVGAALYCAKRDIEENDYYASFRAEPAYSHLPVRLIVNEQKRAVLAEDRELYKKMLEKNDKTE